MTSASLAAQRRTLYAPVDTPALLVDMDRLADNLERMNTHVSQAGLLLRPHAKTHKSVNIARRQLALGAAGITVAKPQEALTFWRAGIRPIFLAYPPVGEHKLAALRPMILDQALIVGLDDLQTALPLAALARELGVTVPVMIEVDVGMQRAGVVWNERAAEVALAVAAVEGLHLRGIFSHEGHAHGVPPAEMPAFAAEVAARMTATADLIRAGGRECPVVSVGSSLTVWHLRADQGITEVRPGTYVFNDARTVLDGAARWEQCALTILATVVSRPEPRRLVIDAGNKVLSPTYDQRCGFGVVLDLPGARLVRLSEEHGIIELDDPTLDIQIGDRLRIIPVHVCVTVNMQHELVGIRDGSVVESIVVDAALCSR